MSMRNPTGRRGSRRGGPRAMRSFIRSLIQSRQLARRARQRARRLRLLKAMDAFREQRDRAFGALRSRLHEGILDEPTSLYDDDERFASTDPYSTESVTNEVVKTEKVE